MEDHLESATRIHLDLVCVKLNKTEDKLDNTEALLNEALDELNSTKDDLKKAEDLLNNKIFKTKKELS